MSEAPSQLLADSTPLQRLSGVAAVIFACAAMIMTAYWAHGPNTDKGYLGGLDMKENTFNWHPVLMVTGAIFCLITSLLSYRVLPLPKTTQKILHGVMHTAAFICMSIGFACILNANNTFIGLGVYILYGLNYVLGLVHYALPGVDISFKKAYMKSHVFIGIFILFGAVCAVETGLMVMTGNCSYPVTSADTNPAQKYHLLSAGCRLGNSIGIVVFLAVFLCYFAIFRNGTTPKEKAEDTVELTASTKV